ncbi:MAG: ferritin [Treponemataceae bacterium]|nr:ferritin [Treponemataceae bacterium]
MLDKKMISLMNNQINKELYSAYLYLDFANFFEAKGLKGFANWYRVQAQEEQDHAVIFITYLQNNNARVELQPIAKPDEKLESLMDPLKAGLKHEEFVTASINEIYAEAEKIKDYRSMQFLDWFVKEQAEEEMEAHELIAKLELLGADNLGLYTLNNELAGRKYAKQTIEG